MFYYFVQFIFKIIFGILFRPEIVGKENMPKDGPVIVAANHLSNWDPPVLGTYSPRPVAYMAKEELFKPAIAGWLITALYAFPVKRGAGDRGAIKTAVGILKKNLCLGIFPEGHRSKDGKLGKAQPGVSLLAAMGKSPVVPVAISGTNRIFSNGGMMPKLRIVFGEPIYFEGKANDKAALAEFSEKIMKNIEILLNNDRP